MPFLTVLSDAEPIDGFAIPGTSAAIVEPRVSRSRRVIPGENFAPDFARAN